MGSHLSRLLKDFYKKEGKRFIFANGMSLNELAWEMWERLGFREIDPSVISRVLNGKRLFSSKQLKAFSDVLRLSRKQEQRLRTVLAKDYSRRFGFRFTDLDPESSFLHKRVIGLLSSSVDLIEKIRAQGEPETLHSLTDILIDLTEETLERCSLTKVNSHQLHRLLGLLFFQKIHSLTDQSYPEEVFKKTLASINKFGSLVNQIDDDDLKSRYFVQRAGVCGVACGYSLDPETRQLRFRGEEFAKEGLRLVKDPAVKFELIKIIVSNAGYLGERGFIKNEAPRLVDKIVQQKGNKYPVLATNLQENLEIAKSLVGRKVNLGIFKKSAELARKRVKTPNYWLEATHARDVLQIMVLLNDIISKYAIQLGKQIDDIAETHGFKRHQRWARRYLRILSRNSKGHRRK